jgi:hypothetical protein
MRFGLKTLLAVVTLSGVALYLLLAAPAILASPALIVVWVTLASLFTAGLIYGRGHVRAFCAGAMFPAGATTLALTWMLCMWLMTGPYELKDWDKLLAHFESLAFTMRVWSGAGWVMIGVVGLTSVVTRIAFEAKHVELLADAAESSIEESCQHRKAPFNQPR